MHWPSVNLETFFWNCHNGGKLTTTHSIFCYFVVCLFLYPILWRCQIYNCLLTSGVQRVSPVIILHWIFWWSIHGFDCFDMKLNGLQWTQSQCKVPMCKSWKWRENIDCRCKNVDVAPSIITCHFKDYAKVNYPGRENNWYSDKWKITFVTLNGRWWSPCRG